MFFHQPVLLAEVLKQMNLQRDEGLYCDCTVGGAGHLLAMLQATKRATFIGLDWDPDAIGYASEKVKRYGNRCSLFQDNFTNLGLILNRLGVKRLNGVLFDLGVSYHQLMTSHRGFSFKKEGRLAMHMSPETPTLMEKMRSATRGEIVAVLKEYGDVRNCQRIGTEIYENRKSLKTTSDLRRLIEKATPKRYLRKNLPKVFQALRIWVNDELINLKKGLAIAFESLNISGRIVVISYHSGEDRIVKLFFRDLQKRKEMRMVHKRVVKPSDDEIRSNPRARSARLRTGEKCVAC